MTSAIRFVQPATRKELLEELRGKENSLIDDEEDFVRIAEAVWPKGGPTEAPAGYREFGEFERSEIIAGIQSLHELVGRLLSENETLRGELRGKSE